MKKINKKIVVITNFISVAQKHAEVLESLFDCVEVKVMAFDRDTINEEIDADVVLISIYPIYLAIKDFIRDNSKVIILGTTISKMQYERIKKIPSGEKVLLVNYSPEMAIETLALFRQIGLTEHNFITYYPGKENVPRLEIAITPGEADKVPKWVKNVVDIGHRVLDIRTLTDVAIELNMESLLETSRFKTHFKSLKSPSTSVETLLSRVNLSEERFLKLLDVIDEGILVTDADGIIVTINTRTQNLLKCDENIIGKNIYRILPLKNVDLNKTNSARVLMLGESNMTLKSFPVYSEHRLSNVLLVLNRFEDQEKSQHLLRTQIRGKGHIAKYRFNDIVAESDLMKKLIDLGEKMARSDASVLITGESGTGKELFAQAIHNSSRRKDYQFVAVNCAAIPENLLESELFGYEEGAFTGAKKGGKAGLFELAHNGTLFLDEIGEMPIQLQSRLLRVIQEKEVMRIGGDRIIPVNVRIVSATNRNLKMQIKANAFRSDLYYRLNVLCLNLPPLRERVAEIERLVIHLQKEVEASYNITSKALEIIMRAEWDGNIRELKNVVEYLAYLEKDCVDVCDLPQYLLEDAAICKNTNIPVPIFDNKKFVLECLFKAYKKGEGVGRRKLMKIAKSQSISLTEAEIRKYFKELLEEGLVCSETGRIGTRLTECGALKYKKMYEEEKKC